MHPTVWREVTIIIIIIIIFLDKSTVWQEVPVSQLVHGATLVRRDEQALKHVSNSVAKSLLQLYDKLLSLAGDQQLVAALAKAHLPGFEWLEAWGGYHRLPGHVF